MGAFKGKEEFATAICISQQIMQPKAACQSRGWKNIKAKKGYMQEYEVFVRVSGRMRVIVTADTAEEAKERANEAFTEADFGELEDVDVESSTVLLC